MNYKRAALILCFFLALFDANGQYFSKRYPLLSWANGYISSIQVVNDTIYAMCQINDTVPPYLPIALFVKFDKDGNVLTKSTFNISGSTDMGVNLNTLIRTNNGGFAFGGWYTGAAQNQNAILILKYDRGGNFQWYKEIPDSASSTFYCDAFMQDSFSNYYLTGEVSYPPVNNENIFIAKTDSSGNLIYKKIFTNPGNINNASGICVNNKGHVVLGGDALTYNMTDLSTATDYLEIYELDTAGNQVNHFLGTDANGPSASNMLPTNDGGYLVVNSYICYKTRDTIEWLGSITKLDSSFHQVWQIDAGPCSQNTEFYAQRASPDGNYIAVGQWHDETGSTSSHMSGWIIKYSGDGQVIWSRLYRGVTSDGPNGDNNGLYSLAFMSDGSILGAGQAANIDDTINSYKGWLLHIDTAGCLPDSVDCGEVPSGIRQVAPAPEIQVGVYPNPAIDIVQVEIYARDLNEPLSFVVYDMVGKEMLRRNIPLYQIQIPRNGVASGLYNWKVQNGQGQTKATGKLVWE